ncbi:FecR family protein [Telmatospirillum siberiense]|uniref:Iron dicitrate transport regulator FecR n=1 Tax=Telmatospirillum siberiense TaxID=382514 RepID=A0A2N3PW60_9PROT|nr:FecR domain-containing protein [Telmatospirillum siberiense]PKU24631.1 iron dicitrate transport regulator FecR [Telmatospirillum siberiense]
MIDRNIDVDLLDREAHCWITRLTSGEATLADAEALKLWCAQSLRHEAAFAAATRLWQDFGPVLEQSDVPVWSTPRPRMSRRALLGGAGALAAAAGFALVSPPLGLWPSLGEMRADYRTATGEQRHLTLAGDISVRMNTQTSITVPAAAGDTDRVSVIGGEVSFAMSPTSVRPLMVQAGKGRTIATQARFEVRNAGVTVCVTCLDGEIRVEQGGQTKKIGPGRQLRYDDRGLGEIIAVDPVEAISWQEGVLLFRLTPLSDVVEEINRYRPGKVILINRALASKPVNGRFRIQRIDDVLLWIEQAFNASSRSLPGGILLLG